MTTNVEISCPTSDEASFENEAKRKSIQISERPSDLLSKEGFALYIGTGRPLKDTAAAVIAWDDPEVVTVLRSALKHGAPQQNRQQRSDEPLKSHQIAPSGRMTKAERAQIPRIRFELAQQGITPQRWELQALARGGIVVYGEKRFVYPIADEWVKHEG